MATIEPTKDNFEQTVTGSDMGIVAIRAALLRTPPPVRADLRGGVRAPVAVGKSGVMKHGRIR